MGHEKENLSGYLDGALAERERGRVEAHLQDCADCRSELEALRAVSGMVKGLPQRPLPAGFLQRLETRRAQQSASAPWTFLWAPRNVAWALCAVMVMLATYKTAHLYAPLPARSAAGLDDRSAAPAPREPAALSGPVSTYDLLALAKEQSRAAGLAAVRGGAEGPAGASAANLSAPAAPKSFGGLAIGEAPSAKPAYSNEALQQRLEAERFRMGIQRIVTPNPVVRTLQATARGLAADTGQSLSEEAIPAPVGGRATTLLSQPQGAGRTAAEGALVAPEDFSAGAAGGAASSRPKKSLGAPLPSAVDQGPGQAVYSDEELTLLWREQGFTAAAPHVDFSQQMLVVVFGQARIESVTTAAGRIVVSYRPLDSAPPPRQRWRVVPRSELPVVFQTAPEIP
jgi:anti-sigma factor RsiW